MNILLDTDMRAKIADFGMVKYKSSSSMMTKTAVGTYAWMAPEVMNEEPYNEKVDIYGFGMVLWEMVTNEIPFSGMNQMALLRTVALHKQHPPLPPASIDHPQQLLSLIERCWHSDPTSRMSLDEILDTLLQIEKSTQPNNNNNTVTLVPVDPQSPEFERLIVSFKSSMQQHHADYVIQRIKKNQKPVSHFLIYNTTIFFELFLYRIQVSFSNEDRESITDRCLYAVY